VGKRTSDDLEFEDDILGEQEAEEVPAQDFRNVVVSSSDWTVETLLAQLERANIDLSPKFQRRDAWSLARKSRFIESLILGFPIPQVVLAESKERKGAFIILDGKQRLLTLLQFAGKAEGPNSGFALQGLEAYRGLNDATFESLKGDARRGDDIEALLNSTVRSVVIKNWPSTDFLHLLFVRLNTGSVPLSPQELRQALFPGPFVDFVFDRASESATLREILGTSEPDFRMRDVELLVRFLGFACFLPSYSGNMRGFLDATCKTLNSDWDKRRGEIKKKLQAFEDAMEASKLIFGPTGFLRKWTGTSYERRPNRAILDIMGYYLSHDAVRKAALRKKTFVVRAYKNACDRNASFRRSIETTTKSLDATYSRLSIWGKILSRVLAKKIAVPRWKKDERRIVG